MNNVAKIEVSETGDTGEKRVECLIPVLTVESPDASIDYYVKTLGFKHDWGGGQIGSVSLDGFAIMFAQGTPAEPGKVWIGVDDIMPFYEAYRARGVRITQEPTNQCWAYEMNVADPDGHILWFGSDPLQDQP